MGGTAPKIFMEDKEENITDSLKEELRGIFCIR